MKHLIIGDDECSIGKIVHAMHMSHFSAILDKEWRNFVIMLNTSTVLMDKLQIDLLLGKKSALIVVESILLEWRSRQGEAATFARLLDMLEHGCGWKSISYNLRNTMLQDAAHGEKGGVMVDIEEDRVIKEAAGNTLKRALISEIRHTNLQGPSCFRRMAIRLNFRQSKKCALCTLVAVISFAVLLRLLYMLTS